MLRRAGISLLSLYVLCAEADAARLFPAWRNLYDTTVDRSQYARDVAVDARGNVAVAGYIFDAANRPTFYVAKYEGLHGNLIWERTFNAPGGGGAYGTGVAMDSAGNVVATGYYDTTNSYDYITFKFASDDGASMWSTVNGLQARTYNGTADGSDQALKVIVDGNDNIIVTGKSAGTGTAYDIYTVKYTSGGTVAWEQRYNYYVNNSGNRDDIPSAIAVDSANNVVVSGLANKNGTDSFYVAKYAAANGVPIWTRTDENGGYGATGLAVDANGNAIVCGPAFHTGGTYDIRTIKYAAANGTLVWERTYATGTPENRWSGIAVNSLGEVSVVGTSEAGPDPTGKRIYTAKYNANGTLAWEHYSSAPAQFDNDVARGIIVDGTSNTIVIGESEPADPDESANPGLVIGRYSPTGEELPELHYGDLEARFGLVTNTVSQPPVIAFDNLGGGVIVGNYNKPKESGITYVGFSVLKLNRFIAETGDPVSGAGVPNNAKISALNTPAVSDTGIVAARVTVAAGKTKLGAILTQGLTGAPALPAVQAGAAPEVANAKFKTFLDPVISQTGRIAFIAKLSGVKSSEATGVWTTVFDNAVRKALQQGTPVPGLNDNDVLVKSISSISLRGSELVSLIKVSGAGVTKANDTILLGQNTTAANGTVLLRTGQDLSAGGETSQIKSITVLSPAKGSTGQGRWQTSSRVVASVTLADKRTVLVNVTTGGTITPLFYTNQDAAPIMPGAKWKTFGLPATENSLFNSYAAIGTLQAGSGVTPSADTFIICNNGLGTIKVAAEDGAANGTSDGAKFAAFSDPLVNTNAQVAFLATLKGGKVKSSNKSGIFFGAPAAASLLARQGDPAPDGAAAVGTTPVWKSFLSLALPNGSGAGPVFLAKVGGAGVNAKNSVGLWGVSSFGYLQELLRTGDFLDGRTVSNMTLLQALPGTSGATRNFNGNGCIGVLLSFKGGGQAIYALGIP